MSMICLNMIVRNEAHVVLETLRSVAPHISYFVVVDTGSTDDTVDVIRRYFIDASVSGEIHHRPWRNFAENRSEALALCRNRSDYIWVIDADDIVVGDLDLTDLQADSYLLRYGPDFRYWRKQIFSTRLKWKYEGILHEYPACVSGEHSEARLSGDYFIESRRKGHRNRFADKYQNDCRILERALVIDPNNSRYHFYLAQSYFDSGDYHKSLRQYRKRTSLGGWDEEVYYSLFRIAECLERLHAPWDEILTAYLDSYEYRPTRAEPFLAIARGCRLRNKFQLGYHFARAASSIPFPEQDALFVDKSVYDYRAMDELAICAYYIGQYRESFDISSQILADDRVPRDERHRVIENRDVAFPCCKNDFTSYPANVVRVLTGNSPCRKKQTQVTATVTSCKRLTLFRQTLNSFLRQCRDLDRIDRWICVDDNSSDSDRRAMQDEYPFFEFVFKENEDKGHAKSMNMLMDMVDTPYWLHLEDDWLFISPEQYVTRALYILDDDRQIAQVLFNRNYGESLACREIKGGIPRTATPGGGDYRLHEYIDGQAAANTDGLTNTWWPHFSLRPSLMATDLVKSVGAYNEADRLVELEFAHRYAAAGLKSAFFDYITCLHIGRPTWERHDKSTPNAYELNGICQF